MHWRVKLDRFVRCVHFNFLANATKFLRILFEARALGAELDAQIPFIGVVVVFAVMKPIPVVDRYIFLVFDVHEGPHIVDEIIVGP